MGQFRITSNSIRGQINNLLRDTYRGGFAVLKELVQNADDAGANRLELVLLPNGARGADHPLLDGPAILAVNDAKFDRRDEEGIATLSDSGKMGDGGSIGRFGLGMKSVFHLVDAFFWLASPQRPDGEKRDNDCASISPWEDKRPDWPEPDRAQWAAARRAIEPFVRGADPWFCLWLPLRTDELCRDRLNFPHNHKNAQGELFSPENGCRLAAALPLLRNLSRIDVRTPEGSYRLLRSETEGMCDGTLGGFVLLERGAEERLLTVRGRASADQTLADRFRLEEAWPSHEGASGSNEPVPAAGSGAALLIGETDRDWATWRGGDGPTLDLVPAVYLPLDAGGGGKPPADVSLVLHGEFFVDAGRQALVPDGTNDQGRVEAAWNREVLERLVLPAVPEAIVSFADAAAGDGRDIVMRGLVRRVRRLNDPTGGRLIHRREAICRNEQLVPRLGDGLRWCLVPPGEEICAVECPAGMTPAEAPAALAAALPGYRTVASGCVLVPAGAEMLTAADPVPPTPALAARLLGEPADLASSSRSGHESIVLPLLRVLANDAEQVTRLLAYAREVVAAFAAHEQPDEGQVNFAKAVASAVLPSHVVEVADGLPPGLLNRPGPVLLLPATLCRADEHRPRGRLAAEAAADLLRTAVGCGLEPDLLSRLARQLIESVEPPIDPAGGPLADLPLFRVTPNRDGGLSLRELVAVAASGLLFSHGDESAAALASAVEARVLVCAEVPKLDVFGRVGRCDAGAARRVLEKTSRFASDPEARLPLARLMLKADDPSAASRYVLRRLFAGRVIETDKPLLAASASGAGGVWGRLLEASRVDAAVVPAVLAELLSTVHKHELDVRDVGAEAVLERLAEVDKAKLAALVLPDAVAGDLHEAALGLAADGASSKQIGVLRSLPIYPTVAGSRVACTGSTFVDIGGVDPADLPTSLRSRVMLLRPHPNEAKRVGQRRLVPDLDANEMLRLLADHEEAAVEVTTAPGLFLKLLAKAEKLPDDLKQRLGRLAWVPTPLGLRPPIDVLHLPFSAMRWTGGRSVSEADLADELTKRLPALRKLMPERDDSLERLAQVAAGDDRSRIGVLLSADDDAKLKLADWLRLLDDAAGVMPAVGLLREVEEATWPGRVQGKSLLSQLLQGLSKPIKDPKRIVDVLIHLAKQAERCKAEATAAAELFFDSYLASAIAHVDWQKAILPNLLLPTSGGRWRRASEICLRTPGVDPSHVLDPRRTELLRNQVHAPRDLSASGDDSSSATPASAAQALRQYARSLGAPSEAIGGLLALLGNDPAVRGLAEEYLLSRSVDGFRGSVPTSVKVTDRGNLWLPLSEEEAEFRVEVTVTLPEPIHTTDLLGDAVHLPPATRPDSLLLGYPRKVRDTVASATPAWQIHLLKPGQLTRGEFAEVLCQTAIDIIQKIYGRSSVRLGRLGDLWKRLSDSGQLDVDAAAGTILDQIDAHLRRLSSDCLTSLRPRLTEIDAARHRKYEAAGSDASSEHWEKQLAVAINAVRDLLQGDEGVQQEVLEGLRAKVRESGYGMSSIPLELFQNADDAAAELDEMVSRSGLEKAAVVPDLFIASLTGRSARFAHWGRPINKYQLGDFAEGEDRGFGRDLRKMLSLSESDKLVHSSDGNARGTTGRFGLGFKSVFLASNRPRVVSGWLGFKVVAGLLPERLDPEDAAQLRDVLAQLWRSAGDDEMPVDGTLIDLPMLSSKEADTDLLTEFRRLAPLLVVFAKRLRRIFVEGGGGQVSFAWSPRTITGVEGVEVGDFALPRSEAKAGGPAEESIVRGIFFGGTGREGLLIGLGHIGPLPLRDVPDVWVTAPTGRTLGSGVAINAPLDVDPGRTQLRVSGGDNLAIAGRMRDRIGGQLVDLFDAAEADWPAVREVLGLDAATSAGSFWQRLFDVMTPGLPNDAGPEAAVVGEVLRAMATLIEQRAALPANLDEDAPLLRLADVRARVIGLLATDDVQRNAVVRWPSWRKNVGEKFVVASVVTRLKRLGLDLPPQAEAIDLPQLVMLEAGDGLEPDAAEQIAKVVLPLLDAEQRNPSFSEEEERRLKGTLRPLRFRDDAGGWSEAADLLLPAGAEDAEEDRLRAAFAPEGAVLADGYSAVGVRLFRRVRGLGIGRTGVQAMKAWVFSATDEPTQMAVLRYLAAGREAGELAVEIYCDDRFNDTTWLCDLTPDSPLLCNAVEDEDERIQVLSLLRLLRQHVYTASASSSPPDEPGELPPLPEPGKFLAALSERWRVDGPRLIEDYEARTYHRTPPKFRLDELDDNSAREAVTELFVLAALHSTAFGDVTRRGNFVQRCREQRNWLSVFAVEPPDPEAWMRVLDEHVDELHEPHYKLEMQQFPQFYQVAKHLRGYCEALLEVAKLDRISTVDLFDPRHAAVLSGTGIGDVPRLARALGIGRHFLIRELVRRGVLANVALHPHCYTPIRRVRALVSEWGGDGSSSAGIHAFLVEHLGDDASTFGGSFDLPLLAAAEGRISGLNRASAFLDHREHEERQAALVDDAMEQAR